jgi:hypothetical protein
MKKIVASFAVALIPVANACTNEGEKAETMQAEASQSARMAESNSDENVYTVVENSPEFAGGITALYTFLGKNIGNGLYGLISLYWCHATYSSDPVPPLR